MRGKILCCILPALSPDTILSRNGCLIQCYLELDSTSVAFGYKDAPREGEVHNQASLALNSIDVALAEYINTHSPAFLSMSKTKQEFQSIFENEDVSHICCLFGLKNYASNM